MFIPLLFIAILVGIIISPVSRSKKILLCGIALTIFWILAVYSVSTYESFHLTTTRPDLFLEPSNYFYFNGHIKNIALSILLAFIVYKTPLKFFIQHKYIKILFIGAIILQLAVFIPWVGINLKGANWWIYIPGLSTIQPSEIFKIAYVLFMSSWFIRKKSEIKETKFITSFIIINIILLGIFAIIPDFGTVLILWLVSLVMVRYSWLSEKKIWIIMGVASIAFLLLMGIISILAGDTETQEVITSWGKTIEQTITVPNKFSYLKDRLSGFFNSSVDKEKRGILYQNYQAKLAIGGWGFRWQGYGKGLQKFGYIPIAQSDFIFAAYAEEIGFLWSITLLAIYFLMMYYFLSKLKGNRDELTKIIGIWLISTIIIQMFINIGVNLGIVPNTGITLPFISHGGTAFIANTIQLMLLYKITYQNELWYTKWYTE